MEILSPLDFFLYVFLALFCGYAIYCFSHEIYSKFDHSTLPSTPLEKDATIHDIKTTEVRYVKNGAKYRTQILFDDGFLFTTYRTNREEKWFSYKISIDNELANTIIEKAIKAHDKAYAKQNK